MSALHVVLPVPDEDAVSEGLVRLTQQIHERGLADGSAGGFFGGTFGYGADYENDVFMLHRYCWCEREGECPWCTGCGFYEAKCEACRPGRFPHLVSCYQTELHDREAAYDERTGFKAIEAAAFGRDRLMGGFRVAEESVSEHVVCRTYEPRKDRAMKAWRKAYDERRAFTGKLYKELCAKHGVGEFGCAVHCTCGADAQREKARKTHGCDFEMGRGIFARWGGPRWDHSVPNFWHKPSDSRVNWYKYIGRGMEVRLTAEWGAIIRECLASVGN